MKLKTWMAVATAATLIVACDSTPTNPDTMLADFDSVDPVVVMFNATYGLPEGPFAGAGLMPFLGMLTLPNGAIVQRPGAFGPGVGHNAAGTALPDSVKLSAAQKMQIQALLVAFGVANKIDLDAMGAAHQAARAARQAGKARDEVRALLEAARPAASRVRANGEALHTAITAVLTPAQRAWIAARRPTNPFRLPS